MVTSSLGPDESQIADESRALSHKARAVQYRVGKAAVAISARC